MPAPDDSTNRRLDVVVIGAGPAGKRRPCSPPIWATRSRWWSGTLGGAVVANGGAPTKTFREAALYLSSFEKEKVYGVALSVPPEVMYPAVRARAREGQ